MNEKEVHIKKRCLKHFEGKTVIMAKHNDISANVENVYIMRKGLNDKISSITKDGYLYRKVTTRKSVPTILENQGLPYKYVCNGRLVCINSECSVVKRLTVVNTVPYKKASNTKCRFCKETLQVNNCDGSKLLFRSKASKEIITKKEEQGNIVIKYETKHTCGQPEEVMDREIVEELMKLFESNPELTPSHAYKSLLSKKFREGKNYKEIMNLVFAFTHDHSSKNIKAAVRKGMKLNTDDLASILELEKFLVEMPELGVLLKVVTDSYLCEVCNSHVTIHSQNEEIDEACKQCKKLMQHTGPIILLTSQDQIREAIKNKKDRYI